MSAAISPGLQFAIDELAAAVAAVNLARADGKGGGAVALRGWNPICAAPPRPWRITRAKCRKLRTCCATTSITLPQGWTHWTPF